MQEEITEYVVTRWYRAPELMSGALDVALISSS